MVLIRIVTGQNDVIMVQSNLTTLNEIWKTTNESKYESKKSQLLRINLSLILEFNQNRIMRVYHSCTRCCLVVVRLRLQDIEQILQIFLSYRNLKYRWSLQQD